MTLIGYPTRRNLRFDGVALSALEALALIALRESELGRVHAPYLLWRRLLATNLTFDEWRKKGFKRTRSREWWRKCLRRLRELELASESIAGANDCYLVSRGVACAEALRPLFQPALSVNQFFQFVKQTYSRVTGSFAA